MMLRSIWFSILVCSLSPPGFGAGAGFEDEFTIKSATRASAPGGEAQALTTTVGTTSKSERKPRKCFKCGGKGTVTVTVREDCDRCDGTGIVITEVELKDTEHTFDGWWGPRTKKTTRKAQNKQPCPRCGRRGKISVKKEVKCPMCKGKGERRTDEH